MKASLLLIVVLALVIVAGSGLYTVSETEQVVITQFGMPVGEPVKKAGLHWKTPFIQTVNRLDKRVLKKAFAAYLALTALSVVAKAL